MVSSTHILLSHVHAWKHSFQSVARFIDYLQVSITDRTNIIQCTDREKHVGTS